MAPNCARKQKRASVGPSKGTQRRQSKMAAYFKGMPSASLGGSVGKDFV